MVSRSVSRLIFLLPYLGGLPLLDGRPGPASDYLLKHPMDNLLGLVHVEEAECQSRIQLLALSEMGENLESSSILEAGIPSYRPAEAGHALPSIAFFSGKNAESIMTELEMFLPPPRVCTGPPVEDENGRAKVGNEHSGYPWPMGLKVTPHARSYNLRRMNTVPCWRLSPLSIRDDTAMYASALL
ncbi:hypothetical protein BS47DRAFT_1361170 [Hydnum rufescens UP504]|uniref:Uncharacterized protein n=1 Tax=Hydnum rufescens UP504 TaxID=1448309 RepID=A0A9P6B0L6_9AGAM|nr:hypothetical protein BS47DRAFT_1361170 [Hydnum rufescens UP504]